MRAGVRDGEHTLRGTPMGMMGNEGHDKETLLGYDILCGYGGIHGATPIGSSCMASATLVNLCWL